MTNGFRFFSIAMGLVLLLVSMMVRWSAPESVRVSYPINETLKPNDCNESILAQDIPKIKTESVSKLYFCWGFLHGKWRGWQADFLRRLAQARASEALGFKFVKTDVTFQLLDLYSKARELFFELPPKVQNYLWLYSLGITKGMSENQRTEGNLFRRFEYSPDDWHPIDTLALVLLNSFAQTRKTLQQDIWEQELINKFGDGVADLLDDDGTPWETTILKSGEYPIENPPDVAKLNFQKSPISDPFENLDSVLNLEIGSNNWVVSPSRSESGVAMLANDPHLELQRPSFFHWIKFVGGPAEFFGASVPGLPVVISGLNRKVSWGITNAYLDVMDAAYVKDSDWKKLAEPYHPRVLVRVGSIWLDLKLINKTFYRLKDRIVYLPANAPKDYSVLMKWSGFDLTAEDIEPTFDLFLSESASDLHSRLRKVRLPAWNFVMADVNGKIAYQSTGKIPRREKQRPFGVQKMSYSEFSKTNYLNDEERPSVFNPSRGFVSTANNRHWPATSALHGGRGYYHPFRAFRIQELLLEKQKHNEESFRKIQCDVKMNDLFFIADGLFSHDENWRKELEILKKADFKASLGCTNCYLFRYALEKILTEWNQTEGGLYRLAKSGLSDEQKSRISDLYSEALKVGKGRTWGEMHRSSFPHLSQREDMMVKSIATQGDQFTVNPGTGDLLENGILDHNISAAHRLVIEMTNPPRVRGLLVGENTEIQKSNLSDSNSNWQKWVRCELDEIPVFEN